jgi:uncharacterized protein YjbI with pentapeptide repeats
LKQLDTKFYSKVKSACVWAISNPLESLIIAAVIIFPVGYYFYLYNNDHEHVRNIILGFGVFGGAYGLVLATKRQKKFSDQVDQGQAQLFHEGLSRSLKQLTDDNILVRTTGINVLVDLFENVGSEKRRIIANALKNFLETNATFPTNPENEELEEAKPRNERLDHEFALLALIKMQSKHAILDQVVLRGLDFRGFRFENIELAPDKISFMGCNMDDCQFDGIKVQPSDFKFNPQLNVEMKIKLMKTLRDTLTGASVFGPPKEGTALFQYMDLQNTSWHSSVFRGTAFSNVNLIQANFTHCRFVNILFWNNKFKDAQFNRCDLLGSIFDKFRENCFSSLRNCDISSVNFMIDIRDKQSPTQQILNQAFYEKGKPFFFPVVSDSSFSNEEVMQDVTGKNNTTPKLSVNDERAYEWVTIDGNMQRQFLISKQPVGTFPWDDINSPFPFDDKD